MLYARSIAGENAASDIVQNVFVGVLKLTRAEVLGVRDAAAYFIGAVRLAAISHERERRRRANRERGTLAAARERARQNSVAAVAMDVHAAMDRLPRRLREVLILKHHAGLTFDQMALALGANRNTLASRYQDALRALRQQWDRAVGGDEKAMAREIEEGTARRVGGVR